MTPIQNGFLLIKTQFKMDATKQKYRRNTPPTEQPALARQHRLPGLQHLKR
jgi:hypothetical protein